MLPDMIIFMVAAFFMPSQCTYRCVVLPDSWASLATWQRLASQCTYRCVVLPDEGGGTGGAAGGCLNAPTGAWCSLTRHRCRCSRRRRSSQCTYRCVVPPDCLGATWAGYEYIVSMHLQVRGAP